MFWYTLVINNYTYNPEIVSRFFECQIVIYKIISYGSDITIQFGIQKGSVQIKSSINNLIIKLPNYYIHNNPYKIFTGISLITQNGEIVYENSSTINDIHKYFITDTDDHENNKNNRITQFTFLIVVYLILFILCLGLVIYSIILGYSILIFFGFVSALIMYKAIEITPYKVKAMENSVGFFFILHKTEVNYADLNMIEIKQMRGYWVTAVHNRGSTKFPIQSLFASENVNQLIYTIIKRSNLVLVRGTNKLDCAFNKPTNFTL